jgi:hypothetical protein
METIIAKSRRYPLEKKEDEGTCLRASLRVHHISSPSIFLEKEKFISKSTHIPSPSFVNCAHRSSPCDQSKGGRVWKEIKSRKEFLM